METIKEFKNITKEELASLVNDYAGHMNISLLLDKESTYEYDKYDKICILNDGMYYPYKRKGYIVSNARCADEVIKRVQHGDKLRIYSNAFGHITNNYIVS